MTRPRALADPLAAPLDAAAFTDAARLAHQRHPALAAFAATLGNTPLVEVPGPAGGARIVAKDESRNPAGSIKDRTAHAMLALALAHGPVEHILEYSGGNLARPLSMLCAQMGVPLTLVLSSGSPASLIRRLVAERTRLVLVDRRAGFRAVIEAAISAAERHPAWTFLYQHHNTTNALVHEMSTGAEILAQLDAPAAAWVASIGTGGTLVGVARALRRAHPGLRVVGATPAEMPYGTAAPGNGTPRYAGSGGLGDNVRQPIVDSDVVDEHAHVAYPDALAAMRRLHTLTGLRVGSSGAANWLVARQVAARLSESDTVVTVFPCSGTPEEWTQVP